MSTAVESAAVNLPLLLAQAVSHAQPERLGHMVLKFDPLFHRLSPAEAQESVVAALELGTRLAEELVAEHEVRDPFALCERLGIQVEHSDDDCRYGNVLQYAEYHSRPPRVRLYRKAMEGPNRLLGDSDVREILCLTEVSAPFLAHELFHHLDNLPHRTPAKHVRRVTTLKLGPWSLQSGLVTLPEIAAGSFAQTLLRLPFHLKLLDLLAIYAEAPVRAVEWVRVLATGDPTADS